MVFITSTNGTAEWTARNKSGRKLTTAPMSNPPALPPSITRRSGAEMWFFTNHSAQSTKSVKVFFLRINMPSSCHASPSSSPPRMWAMTNTMPRSTSDSRAMEKLASMPRP